MSNKAIQVKEVASCESVSGDTLDGAPRSMNNTDSIGFESANSELGHLNSAAPMYSDSITVIQRQMKQLPFWVRALLGQLPGKHIRLDGQDYLTRWMLKGDGSGRSWEVYIHHLQSVDVSRFLHNHPWPWFLALALAGYYRQDVLESETGDVRRETIRWWNFFRGQNRYHAIREISDGGVWTLVITSPRNGHKWGYWNSDRKLHVSDDIDRDSRTRSETTYFRGCQHQLHR